MALGKLDPRFLFRSPVLFLLYVGAGWTTLLFLIHGMRSGFELQVILWLWLTLLFANYAESLVEIRGKGQMEHLRKSASEVSVTRLQGDKEESILAAESFKGGRLCHLPVWRDDSCGRRGDRRHRQRR